jgi:hypothetical protein
MLLYWTFSIIRFWLHKHNVSETGSLSENMKLTLSGALDQANLFPWTEVVYSSELLAATYVPTTQRYNLDHSMNLHCDENLKSCIR